MPDASSHHPVSPRPTKIVIVFGAVRKGIGLLSWVVPLVIMMIGYSAFPVLRRPVTWPWNAPPEVFFGLFVIFSLVIAWILIEVYYAANRETTVRQLQADGFVSSFFALALTFCGAYMISLGILPWWYVLPWVGTILDSFASGYFGINNAAQKPLVQSEPR